MTRVAWKLDVGVLLPPHAAASSVAVASVAQPSARRWLAVNFNLIQKAPG
jgi:hypothetical protein